MANQEVRILSSFGATPKQERRQNLRARIALRVRVRTADFRDGDFEQIADTLNASRRGVYFHTPFDRYYKGMRLLIIFPYHAGASAVDLGEIGEVVRMDQKSGIPDGIAVTLPFSPARGFAANRCNGPGTAVAERRFEQRSPFVATVQMVDLQTRTTTRARTSDLSMSGCYVDTLNPFPVGEALDLWIQKTNETLKMRASVRTQHLGSGMGLVFTDRTSEKTTFRL